MKKARILSLALALVLLVGLLAGCANQSGGKTGDQISATLILVDEDGTEYKYDLKVNPGSSLREALYQSKLIDDENNVAFFVETIDGHTASAEEGVLWMICDENGNQIQSMVDDVTVEDGQTIRMVYTVAPNFDD